MPVLDRRLLFWLIPITFLVFYSCHQDSEEPLVNYGVSGRIIDSEALGLDSVKVIYGLGDSTYSDADGNWNILNLTGTRTIIPNKNNYLYNPAQVSVSSIQTDIIFIATDTTNDYNSDYELKVYNWIKNFNSFIPIVSI